MSESQSNLIITGMMGTGKSSVASLLAEKLKRPLIDTDIEIEKRFGKKIATIFQDDGESAFRTAEYDLCQELSEKSGLVIATGGGFLVPLRLQKLMEPHSVFCLDASAHTIAERTKGDLSRPLLSAAGAIHQLLDERRASYQRIFHHVTTDDRSLADISEEILSRFNVDTVFQHEAVRFVRMPLQPPYPVVVKDGVAFEVAQRMRWAGMKARRAIVVTQEKLKTLYGQKMSKSFSENGMSCEWLLIPDGEEHKNLDTVHTLYKGLLAISAKRDDVIVAFGGGVTGDIAGFVAATYMRGLQLIQLPTTLLAMVDSSIGGKTGVDLDEGKNLVGAFKQPLLVLADPSLLKTLPAEEIRSGMAEVIKHALIDDAELFNKLALGSEIHNGDLVFRALKVKTNIVEEDPFEHDRRAVLNLGHTFGHAIEKVSNYSIRHGYAVAIGMVAACELAHRLKLCDASLRARLEKVLQRFELPTRFSETSADEIVDAMQHDKKGGAQGLRFVVPYDVGDVRVVPVNEAGLLREVLESLTDAG